ncbi:MAG: ABC transporter ATP-binding protein [Planctomycetota bacterium]
MSSPLLRVVDLHKSYRMGRHELEVLRGVDLEVREGEILAVLGQSGSGKSTLLHLIGLLDTPDKGEILLDGVSLPFGGTEAAFARNDTFGFVFQFYHLLPEFTALENVLMPAMILEGWGAWRAARREMKDHARSLLERMGLGDRMRHRPKELSGGERQRVAIARALMNRPRLMLCDEPTGNLDRTTAEEVRQLLWELNRTEGQAMILVTHDASVASHAQRTLTLVDGKLQVTVTSS